MAHSSWFILVTQPDWIASLTETTTWAIEVIRNYLGLAGVSALMFYFVKSR